MIIFFTDIYILQDGRGIPIIIFLVYMNIQKVRGSFSQFHLHKSFMTSIMTQHDTSLWKLPEEQQQKPLHILDRICCIPAPGDFLRENNQQLYSNNKHHHHKCLFGRTLHFLGLNQQITYKSAKENLRQHSKLAVALLTVLVTGKTKPLQSPSYAGSKI